ncbi:hypothetical protein [Paraburkholderia sp. 22B1P]|uniref:hypothetical protein n=1 Tax=Paraburkholderia sp. 22B1P TaxID=3080498 RepID=UPI0030917EE1|nr:hypothetical protein PBP221_17220 [Paraburkholderia sp. 22B1P]
MQDNTQVDWQCNRWVWWCDTRRLFAPPVKSNLLARLQVNRRGAALEPDSFLDPEMPFFNMAVHALCDQAEYAQEAACFIGVHWYNCNIKALAREQQCARGTVYNRARSFARRALALSKTIRTVHESMTSEKCSKAVEQNSSCVD